MRPSHAPDAQMNRPFGSYYAAECLMPPLLQYSAWIVALSALGVIFMD